MFLLHDSVTLLLLLNLKHILILLTLDKYNITYMYFGYTPEAQNC